MLNFNCWSDALLQAYIEEMEILAHLDDSTESAKRLWARFKMQNQLSVIANVLEEIVSKKFTVANFCEAAAYSLTYNIPAVMHKMEYISMLEPEEMKLLYNNAMVLDFIDQYGQELLANTEIIKLLANQPVDSNKLDTLKQITEIVHNDKLYFGLKDPLVLLKIIELQTNPKNGGSLQ